MKKLKNAYVWCEDGAFSKNGETINYTKFYVTVKGIDIKIDINKDQYKILKQMPNFFEFEEIDGIKVEK